MNKLFFQTFFSSLLLFNADLFSIQTIPVQKITPEHLQFIRSGACTDVAIAFEEGLHLPLQFVLTGDLVALEQAERGSIVVQKTFYVQNKEGELFFSTDLQDWSPLTTFITGTLSVGLNVQEGELVTILSADANERKSQAEED